MVIDRYRPEDREAVSALYRRVFGDDAANASRLRWEWQYRLNPHTPAAGAPIWVVREGPFVIGQYATMPVRLAVDGREVDGSWGMDVMVAPERQRQGLGEQLFGTWETSVGAALGLGLSESSYRLFKKLRWPDVGPVPCLVKPLSRRALRRPTWSTPANRLVSALTFPIVRRIARVRPLATEVESLRRFGPAFDELWERVRDRFSFAVRRDAAYLNWKYLSAPHVRYLVVAIRRSDRYDGYAVYRHAQEPRGRVTLLVDFLVDPDDRDGLDTLVRFVDREARLADSDKIRCLCLHAGFQRILRRNGYFRVRSTVDFVAKVNAVPVSASYYTDTSRWHITLGDSDQDR